MLIISYIPKVQALDKAVAMTAALMEAHPDAKFVYIFDIDSNNQIASSRYLFSMLVSLGVTSIVLSESGLRKEIEDVYVTQNTSACHVVEKHHLKHMLRKFSAAHKKERKGDAVFFLAPKTSGGNNLGKDLAFFLKKNAKAKVFSYFKSVHDQGAGLTAISPAREYNAANGNPLILRMAMQRVWKIFRGFLLLSRRRDPVDVYMCFNKAQKELLLASGYDGKKLYVTGYPLLFSAWKTLLLYNSSRSTFKKSSCDIVLFTRGETPGRPSDQNVVPTATLIEILHDICLVVGEEFSDAHIYIKPHPIQDASPLQDFINNSSYPVKLSLTYDAPSFLATIADYAISTYSSTIIDTLALGVPSIEFFKANEFFYKKHPAGSPFPALGAISVTNRAEFQACIQKLKTEYMPKNNLVEALEHREDLSIFNIKGVVEKG